MENRYESFDARVVQELEQRNEFASCQCVVGIVEAVGAGALIVFGGVAGIAGGVALGIEAGNDIGGAGGC